MVTRTVTFGTAHLIFCRVDANFLARGPKKSGGAEPPPEVVLACLKGGPCAEKIFCAVGSPITDAALLASRTPWIRVHTNEEDTPNIKFAIVLYPYKDARQYNVITSRQFGVTAFRIIGVF